MGFVYISGGQEVAVQWVARMNSSRQAICGFAPSFEPEEAPILRIDPSAVRMPVKGNQPVAKDVAEPPKQLALTALTIYGLIVLTATPKRY